MSLIPRLGTDKVDSVLPPILQAVKDSPFVPLWMCNPCHGNTFSHRGTKTRCPTTMLREVEQVIAVLARHGMHLGGLHLEQTGEDVLECVDKSLLVGPDSNVTLGGERYKSLCDPRLSGPQAQAFAERVAHMLAVNGTYKKRTVKSQEKPRFFVPVFERALGFITAPVTAILGSA